MLHIKEILESKELKKGSERNEILRDIYNFYLNDRLNRKLENWKRYLIYLKNNHIPSTPQHQELFKKTSLYIKELPAKTIAIKLAHIPTKDLYYVRSVCLDKSNRRESVGAFLLGSIKVKDENI